MRTWKLLIEDDAGKTIVVPLTRDVITIGRKEGNTIRLTERNVSRFHAKLMREPASVFIEDLESYNGIKINGDRIKGRVEVQEGDLIEIGDYHLALQAEGAAEPVPHNGAGIEATKKLPASTGGARFGEEDTNDYAYSEGDDDDFAGDTQRWEPPASMDPVPVGLPTMQDQAPVEAASHVGGDLPTMDETVPMPPAFSPIDPTPPPAQPPVVDFDSTIRNPSAPNEVAPGGPPYGSLGTEPFGMPPSGSDEASGDYLPAPDQSAPRPPYAASPDDETVPHQPKGGAAPDYLAGPTEVTTPPAMTVTSDFGSGPFGPGNGVGPPMTPAAAPGAMPRSNPGVAARGPGAGGFPDRGGHSSHGPNGESDQTEAVSRTHGPGESLDKPRLVAINTVFAGSVFPLTRDEIIIGRVDDNDLVIEHRSVSRSHAKLVKEPGGYKIVDLKSANGVLLNGEEVNQASLKARDVIELGRVRLRYCPVGERFSLTPEEIERARLADAAGEDFADDGGTAVTSSLQSQRQAPRSGNPNTLLLAAAGAIIVLLLIVIVLLLVRGGGSTAAPTGAQVEQAADDASDEEREAIELENKGKFDEALASLRELPSDHPRATEAIRRVEKKKADQSLYRELKENFDEERWDTVVTLAEKADKQSAYREEIDDLDAQARERRVEGAVERTEAAIEAGNAGDARAALKTLEKVGGKPDKIRELRKKLDDLGKESPPDDEGIDDDEDDETVASAGGSPAARPRSRAKPAVAKPAQKRAADKPKAAPEEPKDPMAARRNIEEAKKAIINGDYTTAKALAMNAKKADPDYIETYKILGQVHQFTNKHDQAVRYFKTYLKRGGAGVSGADRIKAYIAAQGG